MNIAERYALVSLTIIALALSLFIAHDRFTWGLEVIAVLVGLPLLIIKNNKFPLTPLLYRLLFLHALVLMLGAAYTYAKVPLGFWLQDLLHWERNPYDRVGHLMQGFVPAILTREILLRTSPLRPGRWLFFLVCCVCLAFSAFFELFEWWVAAATGAKAEAFLGTQGDPWDTQWDMFCAAIGATCAQLLLGGLHNRQLDRLVEGIAPRMKVTHSSHQR